MTTCKRVRWNKHGLFGPLFKNKLYTSLKFIQIQLYENNINTKIRKKNPFTKLYEEKNYNIDV